MGGSFLPVLKGRPAVERAPLVHHAANGRFAIRQGKWKLVVQNGRTTPGAKQPNETGWWDDLAWIPGDSPAATAPDRQKGKEK